MNPTVIGTLLKPLFLALFCGSCQHSPYTKCFIPSTALKLSSEFSMLPQRQQTTPQHEFDDWLVFYATAQDFGHAGKPSHWLLATSRTHLWRSNTQLTLSPGSLKK